MTVSALQNLFVSEREWRIRELEFCKKIPFVFTYPSFRSQRERFWRICVPIIYAHWEGFVTSSLKMTIDYINDQEFTYDSVSRPLLLLESKTRFGYLQGNCTIEQQNRFFDELFTAQQHPFKIDRSNISANSNLNFRQLEKMFGYFGIIISPKIESYKATIEKMVWYRNSIAHGENSICVTQNDIECFISCEENSFDEIIRILLDYISSLN